MREYFKISKEKGQVDHMNDEMFDMLYNRVKERQLFFYTFLNKELLWKSSNTVMHR